MGYYTRFSIEVEPEDLIEQLRKENENAAYALYDDGGTGEGCKWYNHETEMKVFSKKHPEALIKLHGEGEEPADMWDKYFLDGKMQVCKAEVTYPSFDVNKLTR